MNTSILNYPEFHSLPKGVRQMLLLSETHFFNQPPSHAAARKDPARQSSRPRALTLFLTHLSTNATLPLEAPI
jgi:hypothetical protein